MIRHTGTRHLPIRELTYFPGNARRGNIAAIRESVRRLGQYRSVVVRDTGAGELVIIAGNHTVQALEAERYDTVRCEMVECTDDEARRANLADNRMAELGGYDDDALASLLAGLDGDFEGTGWSDEDLQALLGDEPGGGQGGSGQGDPDDVPEPQPDPVCAHGDVWQLGPHRLLCGDATDMAAVERMLGGEQCDCMWTDPPYGVNYQDFATPEQARAMHRRTDGLQVRNDQAEDLPGLLAGAYAVATAALKPGAAVYVAHPPGALSAVFLKAYLDAGWRYHEGLVWVKDRLVLGHSDYQYRHEPIMYGYTDGKGRRGRGGEGWYGDHTQTTVFEVARPSRSEEHPTMKPVELITAMLANSCPRKGLVYEPFGGSGSTLIAAHELGMAARVVELDPRYCDVICRRFQQYTSLVPQRVGEDGTLEPVGFVAGADVAG